MKKTESHTQMPAEWQAAIRNGNERMERAARLQTKTSPAAKFAVSRMATRFDNLSLLAVSLPRCAVP
jgi:hypothetical protein